MKTVPSYVSVPCQPVRDVTLRMGHVRVVMDGPVIHVPRTLMNALMEGTPVIVRLRHVRIKSDPLCATAKMVIDATPTDFVRVGILYSIQ